jgi:hypothetical protein
MVLFYLNVVVVAGAVDKLGLPKNINYFNGLHVIQAVGKYPVRVCMVCG